MFFSSTSKIITLKIDTFNRLLGRASALLCLLLITLTVLVVLVRLIVGANSLALQEAITYTHAALFMLCFGVGIIEGQHVRVDIFYQRFSPLTKAWIDAIGALLLLLPFALFLTFISWQFAARSWQILETSNDTGGLPFVYVLKTLIPITGILLALQALSECIKNALIIYYLPQNETH